MVKPSNLVRKVFIIDFFILLKSNMMTIKELLAWWASFMCIASEEPVLRMLQNII